jgi:hypothetical protein
MPFLSHRNKQRLHWEFVGFFRAGGFMTSRSYAIHAGPAILHI